MALKAREVGRISDLKFLTPTTFEFMRTEPVDVKRYLPRWLNKDPLFSSLQGALNIEHESYRLKLMDAARQLYLETASWGLADWERLLKITPKKDADLERRRAVIRVKRRGDTVMTVENTRRLLEDFAPRGEVEVRELGGNLLELVMRNGTFYWEELMEALWEQLPAHLTFDFELHRQIFQTLYVGLLDSWQGKIAYRHNTDHFARQSLQVIHSEITSGKITHGLSVERRRRGTVKRVGFATLIHGRIRFDCEREQPDEYDRADFERYLRERWRRFKDNPVIKYYSHHGHDWDGELDDDDEEFFPVDEDFLRLYWRFYSDKTDKFHVRYTTILNPRENLSAGEINAVGQIGAATGMLLHSKAQHPTLGIFKALYIHKKTMRMI